MAASRRPFQGSECLFRVEACQPIRWTRCREAAIRFDDAYQLTVVAADSDRRRVLVTGGFVAIGATARDGKTAVFVAYSMRDRPVTLASMFGDDDLEILAGHDQCVRTGDVEFVQ